MDVKTAVLLRYDLYSRHVSSSSKQFYKEGREQEGLIRIVLGRESVAVEKRWQCPDGGERGETRQEIFRGNIGIVSVLGTFERVGEGHVVVEEGGKGACVRRGGKLYGPL